MGKDLNVGNLLLLYGGTLEERAKEMLISYYDRDLSLAEIADECNITRQGVRDIIVRNTDNLYKLDAAVNLNSRFSEIESLCGAILKSTDDINIAKNVHDILRIINKE